MRKITEADYINALAIIEQYKAENGNILEAGDITIDLDKKQVTRQGKSIILTQKEYALLLVLVENKDKVLSKMDIQKAVWGIDFDTFSNSIEVYVNFLRKKIDKGFKQQVILTQQGFGYYFKPNLIY